MELLPAEFVSAMAKQSGYVLVYLLLAYAAFTQREKIGTALEAYATSRQSRAAESLNGKLVDALGKAMGPMMEDAVDKRFEEMPWRMREKISDVVADGVKGIASDLTTMVRRQDRMEQMLGDVARMVARIEGRIEDRD